jgi:hypothetical protein
MTLEMDKRSMRASSVLRLNSTLQTLLSPDKGGNEYGTRNGSSSSSS